MLQQLASGMSPGWNCSPALRLHLPGFTSCFTFWLSVANLTMAKTGGHKHRALAFSEHMMIASTAQPFGSGTTVGTGGQSARSSFDHGTMVLPMSLLRTAQNQPMHLDTASTAMRDAPFECKLDPDKIFKWGFQCHKTE